MLKLQKSLSEKIYLISVNQVSSTEWKFSLRGQSNNVYEQNLKGDSFSCSCPDHQTRKTFCKHLLFLISRVAVQMDLAASVAHNKAKWTDNAFKACSQSWINRLKSHITCIKKDDSECNKAAIGTDCSICFEEMKQGETFVQCITTCKNYFHSDCIKRWLETGHDTCPLCRGDWDEDTNESTNSNSNSNALSQLSSNNVLNMNTIQDINILPTSSKIVKTKTTTTTTQVIETIDDNVSGASGANGDPQVSTTVETVETISTIPQGELKTDIVFSFDTTCSMYSCLAEVRRNIENISDKLFNEIPGLRLSIISHGDYSNSSYKFKPNTSLEDKYKFLDKDKNLMYIQDFTNDSQLIQNFIKNSPKTNGWDCPECYEYALHKALKLSWRPDATMKCVIIIGDSYPHRPNENPLGLDWEVEAKNLADQNIQLYSVQCLNHGGSESYNFYSKLAKIGNGYHLFLDQFSYIKDMMQAVCFRQYNNGQLENFENEITTRDGGMSNALRMMFDTMLGRKTREQIDEEMRPANFRSRYTHNYSGSSGSSSSSYGSGSGLSIGKAKIIPDNVAVSEADLKPCLPTRFQVLNVSSDMGIQAFCDDMGINFVRGRGFYEFTKPEIIQNNKEIVLMDKATGNLYEGDVARRIANIPKNDDKKRLKPTDFPKYRVFIQSTSLTRILLAGQGFLYEVTL